MISLVFGLLAGLVLGALEVALAIFQFALSNFVMFEGLVLGIISGFYSHSAWELHPALCVAIGLVVFLAIAGIQMTKIGALILGSILTIGWSLFNAWFAYDCTEHDWTWTIVTGVISLIFIAGLHLVAFDKNRADVDIELPRPKKDKFQKKVSQEQKAPQRRVVLVPVPESLPESLPERGTTAAYANYDTQPLDVLPLDVPSVDIPPVEIPPVDIPPVDVDYDYD